jgi:YegS/Rv2252/BmrU family lipid kinase
MTAETVSLFINPTAGRGRAGRCLPRIEQILLQSDIDFRLYESRAVGDLEEQVRIRMLEGDCNIVVAGGDGSIHEAVNGMLRAQRPGRLGVIPTGTGNDFAKACDITLDWEAAASALAKRLIAGTSLRWIDIGRMNDRFFANGAGVGFDAKVTYVARSYRWPIGDLVYLLAIFRCMIDGIATPEIMISADDFAWNGPVTLANISNGPWVGGMFHIAPMAKNNDGTLELLIADPVSRLRICALLPKLIRGTHLGAPEITHKSLRRILIEASAPIPSHLDGEVGEPGTRFEIEVLPDALEMI